MTTIQHDTDPAAVFEVLERLGEGSYGRVYKALHRAQASVAALKVVPLDHDDWQQVTREIHILEQCTSPFVVHYHGSFYYDAHLWIAMEYCAAGSLADLLALRQGESFSEPQIAAICASVVHGLCYLHARGHIHRDIKAANILLAASGLAKLADFGVSAQLTATVHKRRTVIGTPFWMAPEVIQESQYDQQADIWSLGITAIELATGAPPLAHLHPMRAMFLIPTRPPPTLLDGQGNSNGTTKRQQQQSVEDPFSADFHSFVAACLQKDAQQRPPAEALLTHAFLAKPAARLGEHPSGGLPVLQELVEQSLELVQDAREERQQDEAAFRAACTGRRDGALSLAHVSTMMRGLGLSGDGGGGGGGGASATMVPTAAAGGSRASTATASMASRDSTLLRYDDADGDDYEDECVRYDDDDGTAGEDERERERERGCVGGDDEGGGGYGSYEGAGDYGTMVFRGHVSTEEAEEEEEEEGIHHHAVGDLGYELDQELNRSADLYGSMVRPLPPPPASVSAASLAEEDAHDSSEPSFMKYFRANARTQNEQAREGDDATSLFIKSATIRPARSHQDPVEDGEHEQPEDKSDVGGELQRQLEALEARYESDQRELTARYQAARAKLEAQLQDAACSV